MQGRKHQQCNYDIFGFELVISSGFWHDFFCVFECFLQSILKKVLFFPLFGHLTWRKILVSTLLMHCRVRSTKNEFFFYISSIVCVFFCPPTVASCVCHCVQIGKRIGELWRQLTDEEKVKYQERANELKKDWQEELDAYKQTAEYREHKEAVEKFKK